MAAKIRFHRGLTAELRRTLRTTGISLDEEMAQFVLAGVQPVQGLPSELVVRRRDAALSALVSNCQSWEEAHPGVNPYPPSFPERVLAAVRVLIAAQGDEQVDVGLILNRLEAMCEREMSADNFTPDNTHEIDEEL